MSNLGVASVCGKHCKMIGVKYWGMALPPVIVSAEMDRTSLKTPKIDFSRDEEGN
jgi:hypothetical protein